MDERTGKLLYGLGKLLVVFIIIGLVIFIIQEAKRDTKGKLIKRHVNVEIKDVVELSESEIKVVVEFESQWDLSFNLDQTNPEDNKTYPILMLNRDETPINDKDIVFSPEKPYIANIVVNDSNYDYIYISVVWYDEVDKIIDSNYCLWNRDAKPKLTWLE